MGEGNNGGKKVKGHEGTCIKDPWQSQKGARLRVVVGVGETEESGGWKMETTVLEQQ